MKNKHAIFIIASEHTSPISLEWVSTCWLFVSWLVDCINSLNCSPRISTTTGDNDGDGCLTSSNDSS